MASGSVQKIGKPRFDPMQRLLHRFYEPLILLRILDPTRGDQTSRLVTESKSRTLEEAWHMFLDQLSWTCDSDSGGDTVSAIAVQTTPTGPVFILAANSDPSVKALPHLVWLLKELEGSYALTDAEIGILVEKIADRCIEFSRNKVKNYSGRLRRIMRSLEELAEQGSTHIDESLITKLRVLDSLRDNHQELCRLAYSYRRLAIFDSLPSRQSATAPPTPWSRLRHYIGRLGSWSRAANILVHEASTSPNFVSGHRVEHLITPLPGLPPAPDQQTNLDGALRRMFPGSNSKHLQEVQETLKNSRLFDISLSFVTAYTDDNFRPRVHAELQLLEHFYHNDLDFLDNDRYIGCSKPSCYCCDLYMKAHPGSFVARPCHGNLWTNWKAPDPPMGDHKKSPRHTQAILNDMVQKIRKDVLFQIESKLPRRPRVPDSTTGISDEFLGMNLDGGRAPDMYERRIIQNPALLKPHLPVITTPSVPFESQEKLRITSRSIDVEKEQKRPRQSDTSSVQGNISTKTRIASSTGDEDHDDHDREDEGVIIYRGRETVSPV